MTIALNIIIKNDIENLKKVFDTYFYFFDKIYVLNHYSTDGVIDYIKNLSITEKCENKLVVFDYKPESINFAEARNFLLEKTEEDYVMWLDSDDEVSLKTLNSWKAELVRSKDADGLITPYWYSYEDNHPNIIQYRERILKNPKDWVWKGLVHETCQSKEPGKNLKVVNFGEILHNRGKFTSIKESSLERNLRLLLDIQNPSYMDVYYLIRESAGLNGFLGVKHLFDQYFTLIETSIKEHNPALHEMIWQCYMEALVEYYDKTKFDETYLHRRLIKFQTTVGHRFWTNNKNIKILIDGSNLITNYNYKEHYQSEHYYIRKYLDKPSDDSKYFIETKYYNGYGYLKESQYWFKLGIISNSLLALMNCQATYYPTQEFIEHYQKVKNYCKLNKLSIAVIEDGTQVVQELINFDIVLSLTKDVLQNCDITEFCFDTFYCKTILKSTYKKVLVNTDCPSFYVWYVDDMFELPWVEPVETPYSKMSDWRNCYQNMTNLELFLNTKDKEISPTHMTVKPVVYFNKGKVVALSGSPGKFLKSFGMNDENHIYVYDDALFVQAECTPIKDITFSRVSRMLKKNIFIVAGGNEPWNGTSPYTKGIGASETSVINLAEELAKDYNVVVFCTTETPISVQGVSYLPLSEWNSELLQKSDILISSRMPDVLNTRHCDCQILWLHDDPSTYYRNIVGTEREVDFYVCVSETQLNRLKKYTTNIIDDEKLKFIYNIVNPSPPKKTVRVKDRTVFLSSPQRSVLNFKDYSTGIKPESCYVFYGWKGYYSTKEKLAQALREKYQLRQLGYNVVGRIPKEPLHKFLQSCEYMPYFSDFFETFCSAAVEAMYYGVKVITNNDSAILEVCSKMKKNFKATNYVADESMNVRKIFENSTALTKRKNQFDYKLVGEWEELFNYSGSVGGTSSVGAS